MSEPIQSETDDARHGWTLVIAKAALIGLVAFGLWSGGNLSWQQFQSGEACPLLGAFPACYIAFAGYLLMSTTLVANLLLGRTNFNWLFWAGLGVAGGLALLGSAFEIVKGDVCPKAFGWLPMCYISLAFCVVIGVLFKRVNRR